LFYQIKELNLAASYLHDPEHWRERAVRIDVPYHC
jgi:hypothetical protein